MMIVFQRDLIVVGKYLSKLNIDDIRDGVLDSPAQNQQCRASGYADNGHQET